VLNKMSWRDKKDDEDKRRGFPFDDLFPNDRDPFGSDFMKHFMNEIHKMMRNMDQQPGKNVTRKQFGPYIRGYSMTIGPDGKPKIRRFGNGQPGLQPAGLPMGFGQQEKKGNEPLIDVFTDKEEVKIVAELPGVSKDDIQVKATEKSVKIKASNSKKDYHTVKELSVAVKPETAKSKYNNGILEIVFKRQEPSNEEEFDIAIE
jgi:HSP20 family protein